MRLFNNWCYIFQFLYQYFILIKSVSLNNNDKMHTRLQPKFSRHHLPLHSHQMLRSFDITTCPIFITNGECSGVLYYYFKKIMYSQLTYLIKTTQSFLIISYFLNVSYFHRRQTLFWGWGWTTGILLSS